MPNPSKLGPGSHVCAISQSFAEQLEVILPFIEEGLARGEYCLFFMSERSRGAWIKALNKRGIVGGKQPQGGWLELDETTYGSKWADFNSITRARDKWPLIESGLSDYYGVQVAVDETRYLENGTTIEQLCHWEATLNPLIADVEVREICSYRLDILPKEAVVAGLRTHPVVVVDGRWMTNPFYEADRILENEPHLNLAGPDTPGLDEMLAHFAD